MELQAIPNQTNLNPKKQRGDGLTLTYVINFYRRSWADLAGNVKTGTEEAREWVARIKVVMHAEDLKDKNNRPSLTQAAPALSVSDELRKLISLHQDGLIDDDELAKQRARLLV